MLWFGGTLRGMLDHHHHHHLLLLLLAIGEDHLRSTGKLCPSVELVGLPNVGQHLRFADVVDLKAHVVPQVHVIIAARKGTIRAFIASDEISPLRAELIRPNAEEVSGVAVFFDEFHAVEIALPGDICAASCVRVPTCHHLLSLMLLQHHQSIQITHRCTAER